MDPETANRQRRLLEAHTKWVQEEGGLELPVHLDTYFQPRQQARLQWLKERCVGTILDVGCSWGYVLAYVEGEAGVDINPHLTTLANILAPNRSFWRADARELPIPDDSYDTVIMAETLEHLEWPDGVVQAVREAQRVARKRVLITVPSADSPEAESFKHQWLCTHKQQTGIAGLFTSAAMTEQDGFFLMAGYVSPD